MPDVPADQPTDQPVPFASGTAASPTPDLDVPILPDPPPSPFEYVERVEPPTAAQQPAVAAASPALEENAAANLPPAPASSAPPWPAQASSPWPTQAPSPWPAQAPAPNQATTPWPAQAPSPWQGQVPPAAPATWPWPAQPPAPDQGPTPWPTPESWQAPGYPGQPGAGYPPPGTGPFYPGTGAAAPKPPRSRAAVIVTVVAVVVVLACLGFGTVAIFAVRHVSNSTVDAAPGNGPTDFPTDLPTDDPSDDPTGDPAPGTAPTHAGVLQRYLIGRPAGAHPWPRTKAAEALDLTGAAANFGSPAEGRLILKRYGFKDGYTRRWIDGDGSYVTVRVLRFADPGSGESFADFYIDSNQAGDWGDPSDVPGLPDAASFVKPKKEKNGLQRSLAVGDAGDIVAVVLADQLPPARSSTPDTLLSAEFKLL